jgi:predicted ester cyclase
MLVKIYLSASQNLKFFVEDQVKEGDKVMTRWSARRSHQGKLSGIPPIGESVSVTRIGIDHIVIVNIAQACGILNQFRMLQQLGVIPAQE